MVASTAITVLQLAVEGKKTMELVKVALGVALLFAGIQAGRTLGAKYLP